MRIHIIRRGGLAGIPMSADAATEDLDTPTAADVEAAVDHLFRTTGEHDAPHRDAFSYRCGASWRR